MNKTDKILSGKLLLIEKLGRDKHSHPIGKFLCYCGKEFVSQLNDVKRGTRKSCGCYKKRCMSIKMTTHGGSIEYPRIFRIWYNMSCRCYKKSAERYKNYGARGITVCDEWLYDFVKFRDWALNNGYEEHLTIDRINNDGNYEPNNCRWVSNKIQSINKKNIRDDIHPGIHLRDNGKWRVRISINNKSKALGTYDTPEEASAVYQKAKKERDEMYYKEEGLINN